MALPQTWDEVALVSIYRKGDSTTGEIEFAALTETIEISEGDYPGESIPNMAGGRIWHQSPQEDGEITLELYPIDMNVATPGGLFQQWHGVSGAPPAAYDVSADKEFESDSSWIAGQSRVRDSFRVSILWTDDPASVTNAAAATAAAANALRFYATDCRIISHKADYTDKILKISVTFKFPSWNKAGTARIGLWQSADATGSSPTGLGALGAYS